MATPFLAQIYILSFNFPPKGFAFCNGQLMPINQNQALFSLLGTTYGGNGVTTFGLPNLQGRVPIHFGQGSGLSNYVQGQVGGEENHTLTVSELGHTHPVSVAIGNANLKNPSGNVYASVQGTATNIFSTGAPNTNMGTILPPVGGSQPHSNLAPFLTLNMSIALQGIFPSRN